MLIKAFLMTNSVLNLRTEVRSATKTPATVLGNEGKSVLNERIRKTQCHQVSEEAIASVKSKLLALKPQLEDHFDVRLKDCEEPQL